MEFIVTFFITYALFFLLIFLGASALYIIRGGVTLAAAICLGFKKGTDFLNIENKIIPDGVFIIIYIAIIAFIANAW